MKVKLNGEEKELTLEKASITSLLNECKVENPEMVSVQLNGDFVEKDDYNTKFIKENDDVEFLYFMGGGKF